MRNRTSAATPAPWHDDDGALNFGRRGRPAQTVPPLGRPVPGRDVPDPCLVVIAGPRLGHCIHVHEVPVVIGRDPGADFQITDPSVSRLHCTIWQDAGRIHLRDFGSKNGTVVNGRRVDHTTLREGDQLVLGDVVLKFVSGQLESRYHQALFGLATLDTLTQLLNRRQFRILLDEHVGTLAPEAPFSVVIIDVDRFKQVNDVLGHDAGDRVLRAIAMTIRRHLRPDDAAGRLGGDEFAVMLPGMDLDAAAAWAESLRAAIAALPGPVSISIGLAERRDPTDTPTLMLHSADMALLRAKKDGRDTVRRSP